MGFLFLLRQLFKALNSRNLLAQKEKKLAEKLPRLYEARKRDCRKMIYVLLRNLTLPDNQLLLFSSLLFFSWRKNISPSLRLPKVFAETFLHEINSLVFFVCRSKNEKSFSWAMKNAPICLFRLNLFRKKFINNFGPPPEKKKKKSHFLSWRRKWKINKKTRKQRPIKVANTFFMFSNALSSF